MFDDIIKKYNAKNWTYTTSNYWIYKNRNGSADPKIYKNASGYSLFYNSKKKPISQSGLPKRDCVTWKHFDIEKVLQEAEEILIKEGIV